MTHWAPLWSSHVGSTEPRDSWEALLHIPASAASYKTRRLQPVPPCRDSSQDPGLAGGSQGLFLEGRKFS